MNRPLTAAQRRIIDAADPVTGRVKGTSVQLAALVSRGLAFRHPRPPHDHFLTPEGRKLRETPEADRAPSPKEATAPRPATASPGAFAARTGGETDVATDGPARTREVRSAWEGLLELRRMTNRHAETDRPCDWERKHLVQAAALALEAAGHRPAGPDGEGDGGGYRVRETPQPEAVAVYEPDQVALRACAATLEQAGWQAGEYTQPRTGVRYLLASPRRV